MFKPHTSRQLWASVFDCTDTPFAAEEQWSDIPLEHAKALVKLYD